MTKTELLAPAGDWSCLQTAVENGADAVYFGIKNMNMRDNAGNFELNELPGVMRYLHEHQTKGYLTLNTIYYNHELKRVEQAVAAAVDAGVDAIICWDMAVFHLAKKQESQSTYQLRRVSQTIRHSGAMQKWALTGLFWHGNAPSETSLPSAERRSVTTCTVRLRPLFMVRCA